MAEYQEMIERCSRLLVGKGSRGGAYRRVNAPLLSIFLGKEAEEYQAYVKECYDSCWIKAEKNLRYLATDSFHEAERADAEAEMMETENVFHDANSLVQAVYWDVMDDRFKEIFEKVRAPYEPNCGTVNCHELYFVFIRQGRSAERETSRERLTQLLDWAGQENKHLLILSNRTETGLLSQNRIKENYRIAADFVLMANSYTEYPDGTPLEKELLFQLSQHTAFGAGYAAVDKDTRSIAVVSLAKILEEYCSACSEAKTGTKSIEEVICEGKGYTGLLDRCFAELLEPCVPSDREFLRYLPYTDAVRRLNATSEKTAKPKKVGLFGLFGKKMATDEMEAVAKTGGTAESIVNSSDIYKACLKLYYEEPVQKCFDSEPCKAAMNEFFDRQITKNLGYVEMRNRLVDAANDLDSRAKGLSPKQISGTRDLTTLLHNYEIGKIKEAFYPEMAKQLANRMRGIGKGAQKFDETLDRALKELNAESVDEPTQRAYGRLVSEVCQRDKEQLMMRIRPSEMEELLSQLEKFFEKLSEECPEYGYSLDQHLSFLKDNATVGTAAAAVIDTCFETNLAQTRRLRMLMPPKEEYLYCMLNDNVSAFGGVNPLKHGKIFKVWRSDCIERLMLYTVEFNQINM